MTSPSDSDRSVWKPIPPLDPYAGRQHDPEVSLIERAEVARLRAAQRISGDRAFQIRLDRAAVSFALGDELRARQWINEAAAVARLPIPWPELGRLEHHTSPDEATVRPAT